MNIAVIPARGGSKRIPRKNVRNFLGKPIMAYSIEAALQSRCFDQVVVSTDDEQCAEVARSYGASVPFVRPSRLADDYTSTAEVVKHALDWFDSQGVSASLACCLYATAPFVTPNLLLQALGRLQQSNCKYCLSVTEYPFPVQRALRMVSNGCLEMLEPRHAMTRSQDLPPVYHDAGQFYWGLASAFQQLAPIFANHSVGVVVPRTHCQDIDTIEDWSLAESLFRVHSRSSNEEQL